MLQQLINHNSDLQRMYKEGFDLEVVGHYLKINHIPYVTANKKVRLGALVCHLNFANRHDLNPPKDHTMYFQGEIPCEASGQELTAIINNRNKNKLDEGLEVNCYFSSKPQGGKYNDYYEKVRTYAEILSAQAKSIEPNVTYKPKNNINEQSL